MMGSYLRPTELGEALAAMAERPRVIVAGGTDYYPVRVGKSLDDDVLDISALAALRHITDEGPHWRIPALATWRSLMEADLPPLFDGMKLAAREIGGAQIQNTATVCGNVCNASPAADGIPNLLALDARVELASVKGCRMLPVAEFILGKNRTARRADELMSAILIPKPANAARSTFLKLGSRKYLVISIVMVAAMIEIAPDGHVTAARLAVGACSPVAQRLPELERALLGARLSPALADVVEQAHLSPLRPIDDVRGTAEYRRDAALTLVRRALRELAS
jgi:CO/xanthine dehydrogenase FAD-binding subunit